MRAQITGLNAATKNVKDGISLVKTAEGAMQEIQDMLNRMDYLATQSANGTYQDEVDREALQILPVILPTEVAAEELVPAREPSSSLMPLKLALSAIRLISSFS